MMRSFAVFGFSVLAAAASAQERPFVKVDVTPAAVTVGEPVPLRVTVLGPTWFPRPPVFPSFEVANAIVRLPPNSSRATSERVGRETWSGVVRNYRVHPLVAAAYRIDAQTMRVTYADPGREPITVDIDVPRVEFRATVPAGATDLEPYVAGRSFALRRDIEGDVTALRAGDAVVVRYTAELDGLPAMFIPPLIDFRDMPGVSVYPGSPVVDDGPPAHRVETATFVFDAGGAYPLPAARVRWWNSVTSTVETASIDPLTLTVAGAPLETAEAGARRGARPYWIGGGVLLAVLGLAALARFSTGIRAWRAARQARRRDSERYAFDRLRRRLRARDPRVAYRAYLHWLSRLERDCGVRRLADVCGGDVLNAQLRALGGSVYSNAPEGFDTRVLLPELKRVRNRCLSRSRTPGRGALPPLNPG